MTQTTTTNRAGRVKLSITAVVLVFLMAAGCAHQGAGSSAPTAIQQGQQAIEVVVPTGEAADDYAIGAGDILEISVWKDDAMSRQVVVLPDGTITFPLVGNFTAAGKSVIQLKAEMEQAISRLVPEPDLTIIVQQVNSMVVYVIGKVNRPGHIPLNRNITVLQALAMAGGLNIFADQQNISIVRKGPDGTRIIPFNYRAVTLENRMEGNIFLQRGDVIVVK